VHNVRNLIIAHLGKDTRPQTGGLNLNVPFPHLQFCTVTTAAFTLSTKAVTVDEYSVLLLTTTATLLHYDTFYVCV